MSDTAGIPRDELELTAEAVLQHSAIFRQGELESWTFDQIQRRGADGSRWLHLRACGELFDFQLTDPHLISSVEETREHLISDLQDWIAESRFGWGQQRLP